MKSENTIKRGMHKYVEKAKEIIGNKELIEEKLTTAWEKAKGLDPDLKSLMENVATFVEIIRDYIKGTYREVEMTTILLLVAGLLYFINPFDIIPDVIPVLGFTDDAAVLLFVLKKVKKEIDHYNEWKGNNLNYEYEHE